jgi:radical SAM superfamily enzyme YgiQ (UPF0313 family)
MHFLEYGTIRKKGEHRIALIYPNLYKAGNCNLGFLFVYNLINDTESFQCERVFTDFPKSIETNSILEDFDILAFSCSFEMDFFTVHEIAHRFPHKLKVLGGRTTYNPYPLVEDIDYFFVGDCEQSLPEFLHRYENNEDCTTIEGIFTGGSASAQHAPLGYHPVYQPIQWGDFQEAFRRSFLIEISRGCSGNCKFCLVSHCLGKKRERPVDQIHEILEDGAHSTRFETVVLIGPDSHSHMGEIIEVCSPYRVSLPSMRIEDISEELLEAVHPQTVTIAPETSESLRFQLGKGITDEDIMKKVRLSSEYVKKMKLYFMVGLPGETESDLDGIIELTRSISRLIPTTVTVSPFVPKNHTPFAGHVYETGAVEKSLRYLRHHIKFSGPSSRKGFIQWVLSVGDERAGRLLHDRRYASWKRIEPQKMEQKWKSVTIHS